MPEGRAIIEGLGNCYYPMIESLDAPPSSGHCARWVEGTNIAFGFVESPPGHVEEEKRAAHERFTLRDLRRTRRAGGGKKQKVEGRRRHPRAARRRLALDRQEGRGGALRRGALDAAARGAREEARRGGQLEGVATTAETMEAVAASLATSLEAVAA